MTPRLVTLSGPLEGRTFQLTDQRLVIGRHADCDVQLPNIEVSRQHCEIVREEDGHFTLRDLDSRHGILVNGCPVRQATLAHSDLLTLGVHAWLFLLDSPSSPARVRAESTGSMPRPTFGESTPEHRITRSMHLDPVQVEEALPAQARLARELHALLQLSNALQEERELGPLGSRLLESTLEAFPMAEDGAVLLREPGLAQPIPLAERGSGAPPPADLVAQVLGDGVALRQAHGNGGRLTAPFADLDGEGLGLLMIESSRTPFENHHLELLAAIAGVASLALRNVLHLRWLEGENRRLRDEHAARHDMIGDSAAMRRVLDLIARVARADSTVLVEGESGTGKELVAHAIHRTSPRRDGPFIAVNCATLSENLLESELFGHEKGAFTGAVARKTGKMEAAHRGTLFLDEVAEIPIALQAKLLRALQERQIERVGGLRSIPVDVRIVAATHQDLAQAVEAGDFRQDLYFRLRVIPCTLPPLRERREDIPLLAGHFARRHGEKLGCPEITIDPGARRCLLAYDWPGNVRELGNAIERAVVLGDGEAVRREDLPEEVAAAAGAADAVDPGPLDYQEALVDFKKRLILEAWRESGEDYQATAERLGIHPNSLHRMVKNLGLKEALGRGRE